MTDEVRFYLTMFGLAISAAFPGVSRWITRDDGIDKIGWTKELLRESLVCAIGIVALIGVGVKELLYKIFLFFDNAFDEYGKVKKNRLMR